MASPSFSFGPMNNNHLSRRSVAYGLTDFEIICLSHCIDTIKPFKESKIRGSMNIVLKAIRVDNIHALEKPNIKSLHSPFIPSACNCLVPERKVSILNFDELCSFCTDHLEKFPSVENYNIILEGIHLHLTSTIKEDATKEGAIITTISNEDAKNKEKDGEMGTNGNRKKDVIGNHGVAGIKIKGENIDVQIDGVEASARSSAPIAPTDHDEMVANNHGVAGIDLEGTGNVKLGIGKVNTRGGTKEDVNNEVQKVSQ